METAGGYNGNRRWQFADAQFDEISGRLIIAGRAQRLEPKLLKVLKLLIEANGAVVTKEELLQSVWAGVHVVEASVPTAISKLRGALGEKHRSEPLIETIPGVGYRLACEVRLLDGDPVAPQGKPAAWRRSAFFAAAGIAALTFSAFALTSRSPATHSTIRESWSNDEVLETLWRLDQPKVDSMLKAGWDPNSPLDDQRNGALNRLLEVCEWYPGHDRQKLLLLARRLLDAGASLTAKNKWGDTAYSIANAKRYCGPAHPVTEMLRAMCFSGPKPIGPPCLADYTRRTTGDLERR